jgi:hypothetical protein
MSQAENPNLKLLLSNPEQLFPAEKISWTLNDNNYLFTSICLITDEQFEQKKDLFGLLSVPGRSNAMIRTRLHHMGITKTNLYRVRDIIMKEYLETGSLNLGLSFPTIIKHIASLSDSPSSASRASLNISKPVAPAKRQQRTKSTSESKQAKRKLQKDVRELKKLRFSTWDSQENQPSSIGVHEPVSKSQIENRHMQQESTTGRTEGLNRPPRLGIHETTEKMKEYLDEQTRSVLGEIEIPYLELIRNTSQNSGYQNSILGEHSHDMSRTDLEINEDML